jgi:hypothetical protein
MEYRSSLHSPVFASLARGPSILAIAWIIELIKRYRDRFGHRIDRDEHVPRVEASRSHDRDAPAGKQTHTAGAFDEGVDPTATPVANSIFLPALQW